MTPKYEVGQTIKTVDGGTVEIFRIEEFGTSIFYEGWVRDDYGWSQGMQMVHESKLNGN
jgi:hypothetical protein